jgi:hypothetical protein
MPYPQLGRQVRTARPMPQTAEMLALHGFQGGTLHSKRDRKLWKLLT